MLPKLSLSLTAAIALSLAAGRAAHAAPMESSNSNAQIEAAETGNPHSVDYSNRTSPFHSPTNDEINAAEAEDPNSVDYPNRKDVRGDDGR